MFNVTGLELHYPLWVCIIIATVAILMIGISKAGLGGGVGIVSTPLLSLIFPAKIVVGFMLPILILADAFTIYHYRGEWDWKNLRLLLPGALAGIIAGTLLIDIISDIQLKRIIGIVALFFLVYQLLRRNKEKLKQFVPTLWQGILAGGIAGFISALSHSAGIVITMFLLPQELSKRKFVATMALFFAIVNLLKIIPYLFIGIINTQSIKIGLYFVVLVPIGVWLGIWLNKVISQTVFIRIIYVLVFIVAVQLLSGVTLMSLFGL